MSSPMLNNVIIGGSMLTYFEVLLSVIDYSNVLHASEGETMCTVRTLAFITLSIINNQSAEALKSVRGGGG